MKKLAIVTTHPIQYFAPLFRLLAKQNSLEIKIFYTWSQTKNRVNDKTFEREIIWDIPLLEGYNYEFVENVSKLPGSNRWNGIDNPTLISKIENFEPNAVLVFGWKMKSHFKVLKYFKGKVPVWFRGDSTMLDDQKGTKGILRKLWLTYIYSHIDKVFYVGQENKKYFKAYGVKESQLIFAPHAVDNDRFYDSDDQLYEVKAQEWREKLNLSADDFILLYAGKFQKKKNLFLLIAAVQKLNCSLDKKIKLILVGSGPLEQELRKWSKSNQNIVFIPFQNQTAMPVVYRLGDIFCLPSEGPSETWGLSVNEALASGRPVIVSDKVGCAVDIVTEETGRIFRSGDIEDLCNKIIEIQNNYSAFSKGNLEKMIAKWNFKKFCAEITKELLC